MTPTHSIIIPAFNEARHIGRAIRSVQEQHYPADSLEIIVVDNASTDRTSDVARRLFDQGNTQSKVIYEPTPGVSRAKNRGAREAQGNTLIFLDADSKIDYKLIEAVDKQARQHPAGMIRTICDDNTRMRANAIFNTIELTKRAGLKPVGHSYFQKAFFERVGGFNETLHLAEDLELLQRARRELKKEGNDLGYVSNAAIRTSARRFDENGYLNTLARWGLGYFNIGNARHTYARMNE